MFLPELFQQFVVIIVLKTFHYLNFFLWKPVEKADIKHCYNSASSIISKKDTDHPQNLFPWQS